MLRMIINIGVINLLFGLLVSGIDNWGHVGGLVGGLMIAWFGGPIFRLAGNPPEMHLEDQRSDREFILTALGTGLIFGSIVVGVFLQAF